MKLMIFTLLVTLIPVFAGDLPCNCRLTNINRIVNGKIASVNSMPWMVSLADLYDGHFCGATIVNENYVLTAEHCTTGKHGENITIRVGLHDTKELDDNRIYFGKRIIHHSYKLPGDFGDFSLIEVDEPIEFVPGEIEPACLNLEDEEFPGDLLSAGWGRTAKPWRDVNEYAGPVNHSPKDTSLLKYYFSTQIKENCIDHNICVESINKGDSVCHGDSGGPLMYTKNGRTSVVGMASYVTSKRKDDKLFYCVGRASYARLSLYTDIIDKYLDNYCVS